MNVHPGETLEDQIRNIAILASDIAAKHRNRRALPTHSPFGLGLRFGASAAAQFVASPDSQARLRDLCAKHDLAPFTMNAFPFGVFHGSVVKEDVYRPTWSDPRRIQYTTDAARSLALLMPVDIERGSVSTAPLSYKTFDEHPHAPIANVVKALEAIKTIHEETGKFIILSMEPEPGCFPETTTETIAVINQIKDQSGPALAPYLGVCFDTAHLSVEFENLAESVRQFTAADIPIGKCQISAALECDDTEAARTVLAHYAEGVYLHQTIRRDSTGQLTYFGDLPPALDTPITAGSVLRTHFHVPLFENGNADLRTTANDLHHPAFRTALAENGCSQFEVETYTWDVWCHCADSAMDIPSGIARELSVAADLLGNLA